MSDPLSLNVEFTDEYLDNNRALGKMLKDISVFLSKVAARFVIAEKCDIHHPVMGAMLNTSISLRQAGEMADPPVMLNMPPGGGMPRRAN